MASNNNPPPSDSPPSSLKGGEYPPYGIITDDNHGSYVIIATWILACASVLFVIVRVVLRTWTTRKFGLDNGLIMAALVRDMLSVFIIWLKRPDVLYLVLRHRPKYNC
jgi:hypothetical protein